MINENVYRLFMKLNRNEKVKTLKMMLAYNSFFEETSFTTVNLKNIKVDNHTRRAIGCLSENNGDVDNQRTNYKEIYLMESISKNEDYLMVYYKNNTDIVNQTIINVWDYLNQLTYISSNLFLMFLPIRSEKDFLIESWNYNQNNQYMDFAREIPNNQFILGTGLSGDYGAVNWEKLLEKMGDEIKLLYFYLDAEAINKNLFNTMYGIPQILKDLDVNKYYNTIYNSLYTKPFFSSTTYNLNAIVSVLKKQYELNNSIKVVTFNYDEFLENELDNLLISYGSTYNYKEKNTTTAQVEIAHVHGFMPKDSRKGGRVLNEYSSTIVLTDCEYNDAYNSKYCPTTLKTFLDKTTIIVGNSLTDYEERKIFRDKRTNDGPFHFILKKKSDNVHNDQYLFKYFLEIGCIVIFFDEFPEIGDFIRTLN